MCDTHILGDDDLLEVVTTDLSLVSHRLPEQLFQPLKVALVDPAGRPANTYTCLMYMNNATQKMGMTEEKHVLVLNTVFMYSFSITCSTRSSRRLILFSLSISILKMSDNVRIT